MGTQLDGIYIWKIRYRLKNEGIKNRNSDVDDLRKASKNEPQIIKKYMIRSVMINYPQSSTLIYWSLVELGGTELLFRHELLNFPDSFWVAMPQGHE